MEELLVGDNYTAKSFVVYGNTKKYKDHLANLEGKFNKYLNIDGEKTPGWIFSNKKLEVVMEFVQKVNSGEVVSSSDLPSSETLSTSLPTVTVPTRNNPYQFVKFKIYKPSNGQTVKLKVDGKVTEGQAVRVETHNDVVDTVYIDFDGNTSLAKICNGEWQIYGYNVRHTLFFE